MTTLYKTTPFLTLSTPFPPLLPEFFMTLNLVLHTLWSPNVLCSLFLFNHEKQEFLSVLFIATSPVSGA